MKKLLSIILIMVAVNIFGQDVNTNVYTTFYRDTLTATIDTVQLKFQLGFDYFTISIYSSGTDTVHVYTKGEGDYGLWTRKALIDLSSSSVVTEIVATSTVKEYLIQDPSTMWLRLITPDGSAGAIFTINAKKGQYAVNAVTSSDLTTTLDNIEADADSIVDKVTEIDNNTDMIETKLDSIDASSTRVEGKIDNTNTKLDSIEVTANNIENKVATEAKQDTMEVSLNAIQSAVGTGNATLDSLEVTANAIQTAVGTTNTKLDSVDASTTRIEGYTDGLETKADTSNARIQEIKLDIENLKIYNAPATKYVGLTDTVTTRTDTTTFTGTWVEGEIKADDSCEVAIDGSFPSGQTYIITETTAVKLPKWAIATSDKLFVRRYGGAGTVRFYLRLNSY